PLDEDISRDSQPRGQSLEAAEEWRSCKIQQQSAHQEQTGDQRVSHPPWLGKDQSRYPGRFLYFLFGLCRYFLHEVQIDQVYTCKDRSIDQVEPALGPHNEKVTYANKKKNHLNGMFSFQGYILETSACFPAMKIRGGSVDHRPAQSYQKPQAS